MDGVEKGGVAALGESGSNLLAPDPQHLSHFS